MIISIAAVLAIASTCEWSAPRGAYAVRVEPASLVHNYAEIPADVQHTLAQKMRALAYDDLVLIKKDSLTAISGGQYSDFRKMHFGAQGQKMCQQVTTRTWTDRDEEMALVYCHGGWCAAVPTVCNNVSLITRVPPEPGPAMPVLPVEAPLVDIPFDLPADPALPGAELPPVIPDADNEPAYLPWSSRHPETFERGLSPLPVLWRAEMREPAVWSGVAGAQPIAPVPELSTFMYVALGLVLIGAFRKRFI